MISTSSFPTTTTSYPKFLCKERNPFKPLRLFERGPFKCAFSTPAQTCLTMRCISIHLIGCGQGVHPVARRSESVNLSAGLSSLARQSSGPGARSRRHGLGAARSHPLSSDGLSELQSGARGCCPRNRGTHSPVLRAEQLAAELVNGRVESRLPRRRFAGRGDWAECSNSSPVLPQGARTGGRSVSSQQSPVRLTDAGYAQRRFH